MKKYWGFRENDIINISHEHSELYAIDKKTLEEGVRTGDFIPYDSPDVYLVTKQLEEKQRQLDSMYIDM
jgi:hypothetical protein